MRGTSHNPLGRDTSQKRRARYLAPHVSCTFSVDVTWLTLEMIMESRRLAYAYMRLNVRFLCCSSARLAVRLGHASHRAQQLLAALKIGVRSGVTLSPYGTHHIGHDYGSRCGSQCSLRLSVPTAALGGSRRHSAALGAVRVLRLSVALGAALSARYGSRCRTALRMPYSGSQRLSACPTALACSRQEFRGVGGVVGPSPYTQ